MEKIMLNRFLFLTLICCLIVSNAFGQDGLYKDKETQSLFLLPLGYDFFYFNDQTVHNPAFGAGFMIGKSDIPFTEIERYFFGIALYRPVFFSDVPVNNIPKTLHQSEAIFDGRINRHQLLFIYNGASDKPVAGGLNTFNAGAGWGYQIIRKEQLSLVLGAVLGVGGFLNSVPLLPLPVVRFGIRSQWFVSSFDFVTGPNWEFTIAPKKKIRLTADLRMDYYRSIDDIICEIILWYRFFGADHKLGDFAGIGLGFKNDSIDFSFSDNLAGKTGIDLFEFKYKSVFAKLDLSLLIIEGGWTFDSQYSLDGIKTKSPGTGFYLSVQGTVPIKMKR